MAVAYKAVGSTVSGSTSTIAVPYPTTVDAGDFALLFVETGTGTDPTAPTGWTQIFSQDVGAAGTDIAGTKLLIYRRTSVVCDGTEDATTVTVNTVFGHVLGKIATFTNVDTTTPVTLSTGSSAAVAAATATTNSIAQKTGDNKDLFVAVYAHDRDSATASTTNNGNFVGLTGEVLSTPIATSISTAGGGGLVMQSGDTSADSTGSVSHTIDCTSTIWSGVLLRLNASLNTTFTVGGGAYTLAGSAVGLAVGRKIAVASGAYAIAGTATALKVTRQLAVASGSYAIDGAAVALRASRQIAVAPGSYALAGAVVGLAAGRALAVGSGSYDLSGTAVALTRSVSSANHYTLTVAPGAYAMTGYAVELTYVAPYPAPFWLPDAPPNPLRAARFVPADPGPQNSYWIKQ